MALTVDHCCCGCSLRTGTFIIAVYMLTCSVLLTVFSSAVLHATSSEPGDPSITHVEYDMLHVTKDPELKVALVSGIVGGALQCILNIMLLIGVKKEKESLVTVWLVSYVIIFGLGLLSFVISFFQFPTDPIFQVAAVVNIGLNLYYLLVVRSYLHSLSDRHHDGPQNAAIVYDTEKANLKRVPLE